MMSYFSMQKLATNDTVSGFYARWSDSTGRPNINLELTLKSAGINIPGSILDKFIKEISQKNIQIANSSILDNSAIIRLEENGKPLSADKMETVLMTITPDSILDEDRIIIT